MERSLDYARDDKKGNARDDKKGALEMTRRVLEITLNYV